MSNLGQARNGDGEGRGNIDIDINISGGSGSWSSCPRSKDFGGGLFPLSGKFYDRQGDYLSIFCGILIALLRSKNWPQKWPEVLSEKDACISFQFWKIWTAF